MTILTCLMDRLHIFLNYRINPSLAYFYLILGVLLVVTSFLNLSVRDSILCGWNIAKGITILLLVLNRSTSATFQSFIEIINGLLVTLGVVISFVILAMGVRVVNLHIMPALVLLVTVTDTIRGGIISVCLNPQSYRYPPISGSGSLAVSKDPSTYSAQIYTPPSRDGQPQERTSLLNNTCTTCTICLSDFCSDTVCWKLYCNHIYHEECILPWISINRTCPVCRAIVRPWSDEMV